MLFTTPLNLFLAEIFGSSVATITSVALITAIAAAPSFNPSSLIALIEIVAETASPFTSIVTMPLTAPSFTFFTIPLN